MVRWQKMTRQRYFFNIVLNCDDDAQSLQNNRTIFAAFLRLLVDKFKRTIHKRFNSNSCTFVKGLRPENQYKYLTNNELAIYNSIRAGDNSYVMALNNNGLYHPFEKKKHSSGLAPEPVVKNNSHNVRLSNISENFNFGNPSELVSTRASRNPVYLANLKKKG